MDTPYLPALRAMCAPLGTSRARQAAESLAGLAVLFGRFFGPDLQPAPAGPGSRQRDLPRTAVFWAFLAQVLARGASCRWALSRLQAQAAARGDRRPDDSTSAYCQARAALALKWLESLFATLGGWFVPRVNGQWLGRTVRIIDGSGFTMPDTPANRRRWDYPGGAKPGCGFPTGKLVGLFCLHSGRLIAFVHDNWKCVDLKLARRLLGHLRRHEVLLADRAYCSWTFLALLRRKRPAQWGWAVHFNIFSQPSPAPVSFSGTGAVAEPGPRAGDRHDGLPFRPLRSLRPLRAQRPDVRRRRGHSTTLRP